MLIEGVAWDLILSTELGNYIIFVLMGCIHSGIYVYAVLKLELVTKVPHKI